MKNDFNPSQLQLVFFYGELYMAVISDYSYISRFEEKNEFQNRG